MAGPTRRTISETRIFGTPNFTGKIVGMLGDYNAWRQSATQGKFSRSVGDSFRDMCRSACSGNGFPPSCHMCSEMKTPEPNLFVSGLRPSHTKNKSELQSRRWAPVQLPGQRKVTLVMSTNSKNRCHWFRRDCLPCRSEPFPVSIRVCLTSWA